MTLLLVSSSLDSILGKNLGTTSSSFFADSVLLLKSDLFFPRVNIQYKPSSLQTYCKYTSFHNVCFRQVSGFCRYLHEREEKKVKRKGKGKVNKTKLPTIIIPTSFISKYYCFYCIVQCTVAIARKDKQNLLFPLKDSSLQNIYKIFLQLPHSRIEIKMCITIGFQVTMSVV